MGLSEEPEVRDAQLANLVDAPPAPPGNQRARTHGGYARIARERLSERMVEVFDALAESTPMRAADGSLPGADALVVELLAEALCRREDLREHIGEHGWLDPETDAPRTSLLELERRLRGEALGLADQLGMTPRSRARLGLDLVRTVDAATALSEPDPVLRRKLMEQAGLLAPGDDDQ